MMCHLSQNASICKIIRFCIAYIMFGWKTDKTFFLETNIGNSVVQLPCVDEKDYQRSASWVLMRLFHINRFNSQIIYPGHDNLLYAWAFKTHFDISNGLIWVRVQLQKALIAQCLEHWFCKPGVVSSIRTGGWLSCFFNINKSSFSTI